MTSGHYVQCKEVYPYAAHLPALPLVSVVVRTTHEPYKETTAWAVVDTGSSHTILSDDLIHPLQLMPSGIIEIVTDPAPEGAERLECRTCMIEVFLNGTLEKVIEAVVKPSYPHVLLGRDILNDLRLTLEASVDLVTLEPSSKSGAP